ncbi:MAG: VCBS repeat-containing protein, partial [Leptospiraceae bacterium]|nr:VCBS repeat-containing protein [Leptospiraceae bacterium]
MSLASVLLKKIPLDANWKITRKDPRLPFLALLWAYILVGITLLGFNRSPWQILFTIGLAAALDMLLHFVFRRRTLLCPLSAIISASSLSILMNYAHGAFLAVLPVFFTIASKYVLTFRGRHVYNPSLAGIVLSLLFSQHMISAAPAYQWGGSPAVAVFIVSAALVLFVFRIGRWPLIVSFLVSYAANVAIRAYITRHHVPPEMLVLGTLTSPAFYLFTFFMITDPGTSPPNPRLQVAMGFLVALIDLILHRFYTLNTIFYAAFVVFSLRFAYLHIHRFVTDKSERGRQSMSTGRHVLAQSAPLILIGVLILIGFRGMYGSQMSGMRNVPFQLRGIPTQHSGLQGRPGDLLAKVDPRMANVGKWLLSVGDGAFVADVNNDGWMDVFLTNPMKHPDDRAALYLNRGAFRFERVPVPVLREIAYHPESRGVIAGALFYDADNDGDPDLLLSLGYGQSRLLRNEFIETGRVQFRDISEAAGITEYTISIDANALDWNRDGRLDILLANAIGPYLRDYDPPRRFNIFQLPPPEYAGDRRMLNVMHRTWHNANNAGPNFLYESRAGECDSICYQKLDNNRIGLEGERWTLDVATTDFNEDGYTDLYLANDFGPDQIFINESGRRLRSVRGPLVGQPGHDTYKGMNASAGDVNNDGKMDIYVSNVHQRLQAEGSLLWLNNGRIDADGYAALEDAAGARNALNEHRFGWGGALADMDLDGRMDILQANGHIDDSYDNLYEGCPDYWY